MLPDRVSNLGPLTYESGALPIALRGPAIIIVIIIIINHHYELFYIVIIVIIIGKKKVWRILSQSLQ